MLTSQMVRENGYSACEFKFICTNAVFLHINYCISDLCQFYQNQNISLLISVMSKIDILVKL